jgi:fused signal recognition particle receptor
MLGAADTFRAGAIDQLQIWADRVEVPLIRQEMGSDPASVAFDTLQAATAKGSGCGSYRYSGTLAQQSQLDERVEQSKTSHVQSHT